MEQNSWTGIIGENRTEDYFEESNEGHAETRSRNLECDNMDPIWAAT